MVLTDSTRRNIRNILGTRLTVKMLVLSREPAQPSEDRFLNCNRRHSLSMTEQEVINVMDPQQAFSSIFIPVRRAHAVEAGLLTTVCRFGGVMGRMAFTGRRRPYHWLTAQHTRCSVPQTQSLMTSSRSFRTERKAEGWRLASLSGLTTGPER